MAKNATVFFQSKEERAERGAQRGIVRDATGKIIRSTEWIKTRIAQLESKKADYKARMKNIDAELKERKAELTA